MPKVSALASKALLVDPRRRREAADKAFGSMSDGDPCISCNT
jgi:hypothetical protein